MKSNSMSGLAWLYLLWFILNSIIFYLSGYPQQMFTYVAKLPIIETPVNSFFEHSDKLYLLTGTNILYYDPTEYILAILTPLFVTFLIRALRPKKLKYQKPSTV